MKCILISALVILMYSCEKNHKFRSKEFMINLYSFNLDTNIETTIFYQNNYYCLTDDYQFICISNKFEIHNKLTNLVNQSGLEFESAYLLKDTLIAEVYSEENTTKKYYLDSQFIWKPLINEPLGEPLYEDSEFIVNTCCFGEFGGAVFFKDKKSTQVYSCPATCVTSVNKIGDIYFITNSLAHMSGFTQILKINAPTELYELTNDSLKNDCNWYINFVTYENGYAGMNKFELGTQKILDTIGVLTAASFIHKDQLFTINVDFEKTFISKIEGDSLVFIDNIFNKPLRNNIHNSLTLNNQTLYSFYDVEKEVETSGFLTIKNDTISIINFINKNER